MTEIAKNEATIFGREEGKGTAFLFLVHTGCYVLFLLYVHPIQIHVIIIIDILW